MQSLKETIMKHEIIFMNYDQPLHFIYIYIHNNKYNDDGIYVAFDLIGP